jgi:hypothetical protein
VFRVLYFVIPFSIAISIMGTREFWLNVVVPWQKRRRLNGNGNGNCAPAAEATAPKPTPQPAPAAVAQPIKRRQA